MTRYAMGWQPDLPDHRDYTPGNAEVQPILATTRAFRSREAEVPKAVDLSGFCSAIEDQGDLGSCTAQAGIGLLEYFERRAFGTHLDGSRLFLYKTTRNLMGLTGDTGAYLRDTMKAMVVFGVPPEKYVPYDIAKFDQEPSAFTYAFAPNYRTLKYYRLDENGVGGSTLIGRVRQHLAAGLPSMFGFTVYNFGNERGEFEFPSANDTVQGGHAVVAIGYDDERKIGKTKGAFKIRNSWGMSWGERGYGWLPYEYVEAELAMDFWVLIKAAYVDTGKFN